MFEAFKIGVRISLINNASAGLIALSRGFIKAEGDAARLQKRLEGIRRQALTGAAMFGAGAAGIYALDRMVKPATEYAHQLAQLNVTGMKHVEILQATKAAWDAMRTTPTTTAAENLAAIRELRMVFGNTRDAIRYMPMVQQLQTILQNTTDGRGGNLGGQAYTVAKALEMRGVTRTPAEFTREADLMTKAIVASGGKVTPQDFLSAVKYGRRAAYSWSPDFMYRILPTLIQEMKGGGRGGMGGPGNAIMSAYSAVVQGVIKQSALGVWQRLGLIDPSKVVWTKTHSMKGVAPGGIIGSDLFQSSPYDWAQKVLLPALQKAGITSPAKMHETLGYLFPNRTASIMDQMVMQAWKFERDRKLTNQASGTDAYNQLLKNDPQMAALALQKQWTNLMAQLGFNIMPKLIKGMQWLIPQVESWTNWARRHGTLVKALLTGFAALSATLMVGGALNLTIAGLRYLGIALKFAAIGGPVGIFRAATAIGKLATALPGIAAGSTAAGLALGALGVGLAGLLGALVGSAIWKLMEGTKAGDAVGEFFYRAGTFFNFNDGSATRDMYNPAAGNHSGDFHGLPKRPTLGRADDNIDLFGGKYMTKDASRILQVSTQVNIDGKKVATAVSKHQAKAMAAPMTGTTATDISSAPPPIGLSLSPAH